MLADAENGYSTATDLADWLVVNLNMPFRQAHHVTGQIVKLAEKKGKKLHELSLAEMQGFEKGITKDIYNALRVSDAVKARA
jgi:argininosuccinate lyase